MNSRVSSSSRIRRWIGSGSSANRDALALAAGETLAALAHHRVVALRQAQDELMRVRGRADGEVLAPLRAGLANATRTRTIWEIQGELLAIDMAMDNLRAGELCLILVDQEEEALAHIAARIGKDRGL